MKKENLWFSRVKQGKNNVNFSSPALKLWMAAIRTAVWMVKSLIDFPFSTMIQTKQPV